ncbi:MAG TPA: site-specific DNA-methyltransferase [Thermoplasmata archaeon]
MSETRILIGDARKCLRTLPPASVHCVVTSPPYWGLRDYGVEGQIGLEKTHEEHVAVLVSIFEEVRRVLRSDGTLWLNYGDCYCTVPHGPKGHNSADPKYEVREKSGTQANRLPQTGLKHKDLVGMPWRIAFALQAAGWYLRSDIVWAKGVSFCETYSGSVMPESVTDRPTRSHEYLFLFAHPDSKGRYYYDQDAIREPSIYSDRAKDTPDTRSSQKASEVRNCRGSSGGIGYHEAGRNLRSVWTVKIKPFKGAHFAVMPEALVEPCVKAGSKPRDVVLDPFSGSGTVGVVALRLGRSFIGIEINSEYAEISRGRILASTGIETEISKSAAGFSGFRGR